MKKPRRSLRTLSNILFFGLLALFAVSPVSSDRGLPYREREQCDPQAGRVWEQRKDRSAEQAIGERARMAALDLSAGGLDQRGVLDAGRT
jgi:hypothetical protein